MRSGRRRPPFTATITSVPPAIGHGVGVARPQVERVRQRPRMLDHGHPMPPAKIARTVSIVSASSGRLSGR